MKNLYFKLNLKYIVTGCCLVVGLLVATNAHAQSPIIVNATATESGCTVSNGTITVNPSGGDGSNVYDVYVYSNTGAGLVQSLVAIPSNPYTFTGLPSDNYTVTVYDNDGDPLIGNPDDGWETPQVLGVPMAT